MRNYVPNLYPIQKLCNNVFGDHMKSKQFESFDEAVAYCESKGQLKYYGRVGVQFEYATYTLIIGHRVYHVDIRDDGYLRVTHQRYVREHD